ncbi:MAG: WG repeat-containing protein [Chamaesiphon sp.]|nr:WG repeat-containing protein [Chamaesiphon sp.]
MNKSGSIAIEPAFDEVDSFTNGTAWIRSGEKVGYIDRTGKFLQKTAILQSSQIKRLVSLIPIFSHL